MAQPSTRIDLGGAAPFTVLVKGAGFRLAGSMQLDRESGGNPLVALQRMGHPADRLSAIFDDFVTTKRRGLGLGLAISKRIVEQLDGTIVVESEVGRGTAFTLRFPARDDRTVQVAAS